MPKVVDLLRPRSATNVQNQIIRVNATKCPPLKWNITFQHILTLFFTKEQSSCLIVDTIPNLNLAWPNSNYFQLCGAKKIM